MTDTNSTIDNFDETAQNWFGDSGIGRELKSVVFDVAKYVRDANKHDTLAGRKRKLEQVAAAAIKLRTHLSQTDPTTRIFLFGGGEIAGQHEASQTSLQMPGPVLNAEAINKLGEFTALLNELARNAGNLTAAIPPQRAGAHTLPDSGRYGVDCLASFWKKYRAEPATSGQNKDSFGHFVEAVMCAAPVNVSPAKVRTALRYHFANSDHSARSSPVLPPPGAD